MSLKEKLFDKTTVVSLCQTLLFSGLIIYLGFIFLSSNYPYSLVFSTQERIIEQQPNSNPSPTNISHLLFGILGSETAWHWRKAYIETWWRPNATRGCLYLDTAPTGDLLPWSSASPPYRVSENLTKLSAEINAVTPIMTRMVNSIMEIVREDHQGFRWLVMGDDDSIFFVDNMVDILAKYDHAKHYYFGAPSEFVLSNFWFSFDQGFGGAGLILSYPLAKALADGMESCLRRYPHLNSADYITMSCIADFGINLSPLKGIHQIDLHGDISGFLSSHPKTPFLSLHHFDMVEPIFSGMDRAEAGRHLMKAADVDQSRLLQQTICYQRQRNWAVSVSWGYSVHIYEKMIPRSWLQRPIETFQKWMEIKPDPPHYMFNTRVPSNDPCDAPHVFFFNSIERISRNITLTKYYRQSPRGLPTCGLSGSHSADSVSEIHVYSPATKRTVTEGDKCECCDIVYADGSAIARIKFRECVVDEVIA